MDNTTAKRPKLAAGCRLSFAETMYMTEMFWEPAELVNTMLFSLRPEIRVCMLARQLKPALDPAKSVIIPADRFLIRNNRR